MKIEQKPRIEWIDLAKGICICSVVWHHIAAWHGQTSFDHMLCSFRIPLYFFLSGLFFKTYGGLRELTLRKTNKLLVPFLVFHSLFAVVWMIMADIFAHRFSLTACWQHVKIFGLSIYTEWLPNLALWFLLCLFLMNVVFYGCVTMTNGFRRWRTIVLLAVTFLIGACGFVLGRMEIDVPFYLDVCMTALPFFSVGHVVRKYTDLLEANRFDRWNLLFSAVCGVLCWLLAGDNYLYCFNRFSVNIVQLYLGGFLGLFSVLFLAKTIRRLPLISYFGRYSIIILVSHFFIYPYLLRLLSGFHLPIEVVLLLTFLTTMLSYLVIIPLFRRYLPHVTAQKDLFPVKNQ